jgi:hypothetical protein
MPWSGLRSTLRWLLVADVRDLWARSPMRSWPRVRLRWMMIAIALVALLLVAERIWLIDDCYRQAERYTSLARQSADAAAQAGRRAAEAHRREDKVAGMSTTASLKRSVHSREA